MKPSNHEGQAFGRLWSRHFWGWISTCDLNSLRLWTPTKVMSWNESPHIYTCCRGELCQKKHAWFPANDKKPSEKHGAIKCQPLKERKVNKTQKTQIVWGRFTNPPFLEVMEVHFMWPCQDIAGPGWHYVQLVSRRDDVWGVNPTHS